jgi:short chain dehydrogenase
MSFSKVVVKISLILTSFTAYSTLAFTPYSSYSGLSRTAFVRQLSTPNFINTQLHRYKTASSSSATSSVLSLKMSSEQQQRYSDPNQPARFAKAKADQNQRYLDITSVYDASFLKGKRVAVTGANRGIGLALAKELTEAGAQLVAIVRSSSIELDALQPVEIVSGIDVTNDAQCASIASQIKGGPIDIVRDSS